MKVAKEEQAFWDAVFALALAHLLKSERTCTQANAEAAIYADDALAARRARSQ